MSRKAIKNENEVIDMVDKKEEGLYEDGEGIEEEVEDEQEFEPQSFYDNDGHEVLFPDGPKMELVEEWKSKYGAVYLTEFDEEVFLWRTLTRKEYKDVMKNQQADSFYKEERICDRCILWPDEYNFLKMTHGKAGIPSLISEQIMEKSGFTARVGAIRV